MAFPFRQPVTQEDSSEEKWEPPEYFTPQEPESESPKWTPPDYFIKASEKKKQEPSFLKKFAEEVIHPSARPINFGGIAEQFAKEHPTITGAARRFFTGPSKEELGGRELAGPGMMEIPGVNKATDYLASKIQSDKYPRAAAFGASVVKALGDTAASGFDPRTAGIKDIPDTPSLSKEVPYRMAGEISISKDLPSVRRPVARIGEPLKPFNAQEAADEFLRKGYEKVAAKRGTPEDIPDNEAARRMEEARTEKKTIPNPFKKKLTTEEIQDEFRKFKEDNQIKEPEIMDETAEPWLHDATHKPRSAEAEAFSKPSAFRGQSEGVKQLESDKKIQAEKDASKGVEPYATYAYNQPEVGDYYLVHGDHPSAGSHLFEDDIKEKGIPIKGREKVEGTETKWSPPDYFVPEKKDITAGFGGSGHPESEGYSDRVLSLASKGESGLSIEKGAEAKGRYGNPQPDNVTHVVYRNKEGEPIAIARVITDSKGNNLVNDLALDKSKGLLGGRAMKAIGDKLAEIGATEPAGTISDDAKNFFNKMKKSIEERRQFDESTKGITGEERGVAGSKEIPQETTSDWKPANYESLSREEKAEIRKNRRAALWGDVEISAGRLKEETGVVQKHLNRATERLEGKISEAGVTEGAAEKVESLSEKLRSKAQEFEDKALDRIKKRGTFGGGRLTAGLPADDLADLAIIGASRIAKGAIRFADWSASMIKDFGEAIKPHLQAIFKAAQEQHMKLNPDDPINKLAKGLTEAKPLEAEQADIYTKEKAPRISAASKVSTSGEAGFYEQLSKLKGEHTKVEFDPMRKKLSQDEIDHLFNTITKAPEDEYTKINAKEGLSSILKGNVPQANQIDKLERIFGREFPELKEMRAGSDDFLTKLANFSSKTTRSVLGFHIPGTALSFHGFNEAIRNTMFGPNFNPISAAKRFGTAANYLVRPLRAQAFLDINAEGLQRAISDGGLKVATGDIGLSPLFKGDNFITKGFNYLTNPKPLFGQVIPALKLKSYEGLLQQYRQAGIAYKQAAKLAGEATNNIYGGLNLKALQRSPVTQKLFRAAALAPDWLESNARLGKGMFNAIKNPSNPANKVYAVGIANFLGSYAALNVLNSINNDGRFMFQNEVGHEFDVAYGKDSAGRVRYFSPYGTAMDMVRIPLEIAHAAVEGNIGRTFQDIRSRESEPLQFLTDLASNTDYAGRALYGKTKFGKDIPPEVQAANILKDAAGHFLPVGIEAGANLAQGKISPEEFGAQALQLPMKYKFPEQKQGHLRLRRQRALAP